MEIVLRSIPFLERLEDDELYRLCFVLKDYKELCRTYVSSRVKRRYGINISSLGDFGPLALYSEGKVTAVDSLLRSILKGRMDMERHFRRLAGEDACDGISILITLIGYAMIGDLERMKPLIERCIDPKQDDDQDLLQALYAISELEQQAEISAYIRTLLSEDRRQWKFEDLINRLYAFNSVDLLEYLISVGDRRFPEEFDMRSLIFTFIQGGLESEDMIFLKLASKFFAKYDIIPDTDLILLIMNQEDIDAEFLDGLITPSNFDFILRYLGRGMHLPIKAKWQGEFALNNLIGRYPHYLEASSNEAIWSVLRTFTPIPGESHDLIAEIEMLRDIVEAMLRSDIEKARKLGEWIVGLSVPSLRNFVRDPGYWFIIPILAIFGNLAAIKDIAEPSPPAASRSYIINAANIAEEIGHKDLANYLRGLSFEPPRRRIVTRRYHPKVHPRSS